jgi:Sec-independent protein translocase protein TatA
MRNISIGQFIIIILLGFFLFSDVSKIMRNVTNLIKNLRKKKSRKKGS